ncbi:MAG TPA: helix-turn-helix transcriptional regulator, partial [Terriglobales bacterium]|nr:helix-turn-helix transcriptional regulator [Terriglobales bacterium]
RDAPAPPWLARAVDYLEGEIAAGAASVRVRDAAAAAGVHPVHLTRAFRRRFGCTVTAWARRRRVHRTAAELVDARGTLSTVAHGRGFADQSHMNRVFRRETGLLPAAFRDLAEALEAHGPARLHPF